MMKTISKNQSQSGRRASGQQEVADVTRQKCCQDHGGSACKSNKPIVGMLPVTTWYSVETGQVCLSRSCAEAPVELAFLKACLQRDLKRAAYNRLLAVGLGWRQRKGDRDRG